MRKCKHGLCGTPEYRTWIQMRARCTFPGNKDYPRYGGRGITVAPEWNDFPAFLAHVGPRPSMGTLDRINNDGNYEPGNVRWASRAEQARNRRWPTRPAPRQLCKRGHKLDEVNTYIHPGDGKRECKTCQADRGRLQRSA